MTEGMRGRKDAAENAECRFVGLGRCNWKMRKTGPPEKNMK